MVKNNIKFGGIAINSKHVKKDDLFVAIKGKQFDGHDFVEEAFSKGAVGAIVESQNLNLKLSAKSGSAKGGKTIIRVKDTRTELSKLAAEFYGDPSKKMKVIGITGTNGKTTIALLLDKVFSDAGFKTGIIGTIFYKAGAKVINADRTTPDALTLNYLLNQMAEVKTDYAILEVSSHALQQRRTSDIYYDMAIFTNLTREHLDYHKNMKGYFLSKAKIFDNLKKDGIAILNRDDPKSKVLIKRIKKKIFTYGIKQKADITASEINSNIKSSAFKVNTNRGTIRLDTKLLGIHNVSNILAAISAAYLSNLNLNQIESSISNFHSVPGRLEPVRMGHPFSIFIDYAHTEDALTKVLSTLSCHKRRRIITVFGCGGDRDKSKRPLMGRVATEISDYTILTNDNPRSEKPKAIAKDIEKGIDKKTARYSIILNRRQAIKKALDMAEEGDIVLIAGKGHEQVQVIGDKYIRFDDREVVKELLQ